MIFRLFFAAFVIFETSRFARAVSVTGKVIDADSGKLLPARVYLKSSDGRWFFPESEGGTAFDLKRQNGASVEMHTTLSADPFTVELPPGKYLFIAEHGKEFFPAEQELQVEGKPAEVTLKLKRWINMAERGWYSGDTHSHRALTEMTNLVLAEDVNVGFPLSHWVTVAGARPQNGNKVTNAATHGEVLAADATHLIWPLNTEFEIFTTGGKSHTQGAILALGQKTPIEQGVPPVRPALAKARSEGALLDLEKHSWPWSVAMVPVLKVELYELSNNHIWRAPFGFSQWTLPAAGKYMNLEMDSKGFTEWGWLDFGFQTYYALLNCGFKLRPTAGTAAGVHPVPFGFGRVYVRQPDGFSYEHWMKELAAGRSFVTTGPMLFVQVNGKDPGSVIRMKGGVKFAQLNGSVESAAEIERIEVVVNGQVVKQIAPSNKASAGVYKNSISESVNINGSSWMAVRVFEKNGGRRNRFAHSSPIYCEVQGQPLRPRREEIDYLIGRVKEEIARNEGVLAPDAMEEYREALRVYEGIAKEVR